MATYEEVKDILNQPQKYLIDVRNADEIVNSGVIPGSINIPLSELKRALSGEASKFKTKYGRDMPPKDAVIIFTCQSGGRATNAAAMAKELAPRCIKAPGLSGHGSLKNECSFNCPILSPSLSIDKWACNRIQNLCSFN